MKTNRIISIVLATLVVVTAFILPLTVSAENFDGTTLTATWETDMYSATTGGKTTGTTGRYIRTTDYIDVSAYSNVAISFPSSYEFNMFFYNSSKSFISAVTGNYGYISTPQTNKLPKNTKYITVTIYKNPITVADASNIVLKGQKLSTIDTSVSDASLTINKYEMQNVLDATNKGTGKDTDVANVPNSATAFSGVEFKITKVYEVTSTYYTKEGVSLPTVTQARTKAASDPIASYTQTTNSNGIATFNNLPLGIYLVQETKAPNHVTISSEDFVVSVPTTSTDGLKWEYNLSVYPKNQTKYADVRIKKTDVISSSTVLGGAKFDVYKSEDNSTFTKINSSAYTTESSGYVTISNLPVNYYYKLVETTAPTGYVLDNYNVENVSTYFYLNESGEILSRNKSTTISSPSGSTPATIKVNNSKPYIDKYIDKTKGVDNSNRIKGTSTIFRTATNDYQYYTVKVRTPNLKDMSKLQTFKVTDSIGFTAIAPEINRITVDVNGSALDNSAYTFTATTNDTTWRKNYNTELVFDASKLLANTNYFISYKTYLVTTVSNQAKVVYSLKTASGSTETNTITSNTVTFKRYDYKFKKTDSQGNPLQGAKFQVFESEADARALKNPLKGIYWDNINGTYEWTSNSSGEVNIYGAFDLGDTESGSKTFWLVETKAPQGYNLLAEPIQITVNASSGNSSQLSIVNTETTVFPLTGNQGYLSLIITGILLIAVSTVILSFKKHRKQEEI